MVERTISSWDEFDNLVFADSWNADIERHRSNLVFRGLPDRKYDLLPSLNRVCGPKLELEKPLIRNFAKYSLMDNKQSANFWETISLAQHHGLPTRLLDWTFSPYVALHFATENFAYYDADCAIWCMDFVKSHEYLPNTLKQTLSAHYANGFSVEMLNEVASDFESLLALEKTSRPFVLFFEPPSLDSRIINQYALFSVMSNPATTVTDWLLDHEDLYFKIIIPAKLKLEFRDKLDQINMTERMIYPGLDGLCKWLARHYTPRENIYRE